MAKDDSNPDVTPTAVTTADVANAKNLNLSLSAVRQALDDGSTAVVAALTSIASAVASSLIGGTTGSTDNAVLVSKGTGGHTLEATPVTIDPSTGDINTNGGDLTVDDITADTVTANTIGLAGTYTALSSTVTTLTGISAHAKLVVLNIVGMSWDDTQALRFRIGPSGGVATSGYLSASNNIVNAGATSTTNATTGFDGIAGNSAAAVYHGSLIFTLADATSNTWTLQGLLSRSDSAQTYSFAGSVPLSGVLERIAITTVAATALADAGSVSVMVYT